jgi:hypothetical protein
MIFSDLTQPLKFLWDWQILKPFPHLSHCSGHRRSCLCEAGYSIYRELKIKW